VQSNSLSSLTGLCFIRLHHPPTNRVGYYLSPSGLLRAPTAPELDKMSALTERRYRELNPSGSEVQDTGSYD